MMLNHLAPGNSARLAATIALISLVFAPCSLAEARHRGCDHKRHHDATCTGHEARRRHATGRKKAKPEGSLGQSSASSTTTRQPGVPTTSADPLFPPNSVPVTSADPLFPPNSVPVTSADPLFSPSSVWNAPLPADAPFDPNSSAVVANLLHQEVTESLGIATTSYGVPIYTVSENQPLVHITLDQGPAQADLQDAFDAVPLPANAKPAAGTDGNLAVYQPSTNTMWEFWRLSKQADGWHAQWGGRMPNVSNNPGYYQNVVSPSGTVLERASWGTTAASFPLVAGVMTIAELRSGVIPHALGLAITNTCGGVWAWPAQRTDGVTPEPCVPEGAHFRLDPNLNLASLHLGHFALMMAQAAQTYGIIINNRSDGFTFRGEDPTQYEAEYGYNPYNGPDGQLGSPGALFDQWPSQILEQFPWSHLELLQMDLQSQADTTPVVEP